MTVKRLHAKMSAKMKTVYHLRENMLKKTLAYQVNDL